MKNALKRLIRQTLNRFGYELVLLPKGGVAASRPDTQALDISLSLEDRYRHAVGELGHCQAMRQIHEHDSAEIEALYRKFVFPDLRERTGRAGDLNGLIGTTVSEGIYIVRALQETSSLPGDVCEFGVAQGATTKLIAGEIISGDKSLWLYDSFEGLPEPSPEDVLIDDIFKLGSMKDYKGTMRCSKDEVVQRLASLGFPEARTNIKVGWVEETAIGPENPYSVSFAYIDFDFYSPILFALKFVDERMPVGGQIIVDDYGFFSKGAEQAVTEFMTGRGESYELLKPLELAGHFVILRKVAA